MHSRHAVRLVRGRVEDPPGIGDGEEQQPPRPRQAPRRALPTESATSGERLPKGWKPWSVHPRRPKQRGAATRGKRPTDRPRRRGFQSFPRASGTLKTEHAGRRERAAAQVRLEGLGILSPLFASHQGRRSEPSAWPSPPSCMFHHRRGGRSRTRPRTLSRVRREDAGAYLQ